MKTISIKQLYLWAGLYILIQTLCIALEFYYIAALPFIILVVAGAVYRLDILMLSVVALTPLSLNLEQLELGGVGFYLPTEPLLFGVLVLFVFKLLFGESVHPKIYKHPISFVVYAYLGWMLATTVTSEMPMVSLKHFISRAWFVVG
ncbi:MAG: hypothetical protein AAF193_02085, partial [Bacteroidota bacterium]